MPVKCPFKNAYPEEVDAVLRVIGERIKLARKRRDITQKNLAEMIFTTRQTVAKMEKGDPSISFGLYLTLAFCLNLLSEFKDLLLPDNDIEGNFLERKRQNQRKRVRPKYDPELDF